MKWIPVTERLPLELDQTGPYTSVQVIAKTKDRVFPAEFAVGTMGEPWRSWVDHGSELKEDIIAWQPMPALEDPAEPETFQIWLVSYVWCKKGGMGNGEGRFINSRTDGLALSFEDIKSMENKICEQGNFASVCIINICRLADEPISQWEVLNERF